jgi:uncharacterized protein (TIGR02246 family)
MDEACNVVKRWADAFNAGTAGVVAALYAPGATIWGTLAQTLTATPRDIEAYFVGAAHAGLSVELGEHVSSPISPACVIDTGHYEFSRSMDGQMARFPARYSFVLVKQNGAWAIAHHHSSMMPKPLA